MATDDVIIQNVDQTSVVVTGKPRVEVLYGRDETHVVVTEKESHVLAYEKDGAQVLVTEKEVTQVITECKQGPPGPKGDKGDQGDIGPQGPVGMVWMDEYDPSATYQKGNFVSYYGSAYVYVNDTPFSGQPVENNINYWQVLVERGADGAPGSSTDEIAIATFEPNGFENLTSSYYEVDSTNRIFKIRPSASGGSYSVWLAGQKWLKSIPEQTNIPSFTATYYAYFDTDGVLKLTTDPDSITYGSAFIAVFLWDNDTQIVSYLGEERHSIRMNFTTHRYLNDTLGAQYKEGFDIAYTPDGDGSTDTELRIALSPGKFYDEDLLHVIVNSSTPVSPWEQALSPVLRAPIFYREGVDKWIRRAPTLYPIIFGVTMPTYNRQTSGSWVLDDVEDESYFVMWVAATTKPLEPIILLMGQVNSKDVEVALNNSEIIDFKYGNIPSSDIKILYRITFKSGSSFGNSYKARLVRIDDYRLSTNKYISKAITYGGTYINSDGDKTYVHTQGLESTEWKINHKLSKTPSVEVIESNGDNVEGDVLWVDDNNVRITFSHPISGTAYLN